MSLGLSGCALFTAVLDDSDDGALQSLRVGETVRIELDGNITAGFEWARIDPDTLDASPLRVLTEGEYRACDNPNVVGEGGTYVFRYRATEPGTVVLRFVYRKPSEPDLIEDTYEVTVWVH
jgi:predicted secreted protein